MTDLTGKTALVTGGASGIGLEIARTLARAGAGGTVLDLHEPAAGVLPVGWGAVTADVTDEGSIAAALEPLGTLDVLVLAAGIVPPWTGLTGFDGDAWERVLRVNVFGVAASLARAQAQLAQDASVVAVASLNSWRGDPNIPSYVASKHAVLGIVKSAALEFGSRGIRVNCVAPGPIATDALLARMATRATERGVPVESALSMAAQQTALLRIATVEEVAKVALFLASDLSSGLTGHMIPVDGGIL